MNNTREEFLNLCQQAAANFQAVRCELLPGNCGVFVGVVLPDGSMMDVNAEVFDESSPREHRQWITVVQHRDRSTATELFATTLLTDQQLVTTLQQLIKERL